MPVAVTGGRVELLGAAADIQIIRMGSRTNEPAEWRANLSALRRACELLGITNDVVVNEVRYDRGRWAGMHAFHGGAHHISVARWAHPGFASRVLWHELRHAEQSERLGHAEFSRDYLRYGRKGAGYQSNPYEVEARATENMHIHTLRLTY